MKMYGIVSLVLVCLAAGNATPALAQDAGAVYSITNSSLGNEVLIYTRGGDGVLTAAGAIGTGGMGTGGNLTSQGSTVVSDDQRLLFAVNAGSNSVAVFRIGPHGTLQPTDVFASGGTMPTSVAYRDGLLYVLNAGTPNNVSGFRVDSRGRVTPLVNSSRPLSAASASPSQVGFSEDGATLIVTERATNSVTTFSVDGDGYLEGPYMTPSAGPTPFGFAVDKRNTLLVSEAGLGGGASTYVIGDDSQLLPGSSAVMTGQRAACWAVITKNGRFGYVSNAGSGTITGFAIHTDGTASPLHADGVTALIGGNPTDMAISHNGRYLYVRVGALGTIAVFRIEANGGLTPVASSVSLPGSAFGLAAF